MAKQVTIKVSKKDPPVSVQVTFQEPESLDDPRWNELVPKGAEDINTLACQSLRVSMQAGARELLDSDAADGGKAQVQAFVNSYSYESGRKGGARPRPKLSAKSAKAAKFTPEQLAMLREAGMVIEAA